MPQILSPGVYVQEFNYSGYVPAVSTSIGAFAGDFAWGPVNEVTTVTNLGFLVYKFGRPNINNFATFWTAANFLRYSQSLKLIRAVNNTNSKNATSSGNGLLISNGNEYRETYSNVNTSDAGTFTAKYPGEVGNSLHVSMCPSGNAFNSIMSATATCNTGNAEVAFSANTKSDAKRALQPDDYIRIGSSAYWQQVIAINSDGTRVTVNNANSLVNAVANTVVAKWRWADWFGSPPDTTVNVLESGGANDECHIIVVDRLGKFTGRANAVLERFPFLSVAKDIKLASGLSNYYRDALERRSAYVYSTAKNLLGTNWDTTYVGTSFTLVNKPEYVNLSGGTQGALTDAMIMLAYDQFADKESQDISLVMTGDHSTTVKRHVLENIVEARKDCVAFISPNRDSVVFNEGREVDDVSAYRDEFISSSYGFFVDNWKYMYDNYRDVYCWVPLDGDIAGLAAQTDANRDAWWSFAGFNRGQVKGVVKLAWKANQSMRDILYPKGINSVVTFPGEGPILFGDRTMLRKPSAFDRINVRRLFIVLEKAISIAARYSLFEFNDSFTRAQFVNMIEPYLRDVQGRRGIEDFRVVCDESNNTPVVIQRNEFVGSIYIRPNYSINGITLNFNAVGPTVSFEEIIEIVTD